MNNKILAGGEKYAKRCRGWSSGSLREIYAHDPNKNQKKGVLLTPQGGFFLYGNRFCSIEEYELELFNEDVQIQGSTVHRPLFFSILQDCLYVTGDKPYKTELVSLIFHIKLDEDDLLCGIMLALEQEVQLALFCDPSTEELYRLSRRIGAYPAVQVQPNDGLQRYAEKVRRNDLHWLTSLYLQGQQFKHSNDLLRSK